MMLCASIRSIDPFIVYPCSQTAYTHIHTHSHTYTHTHKCTRKYYAHTFTHTLNAHHRYGLVNEGNIRMLARELLEYLAVSDADFKPDLTSKICTLIQRFAPDRRWQIDNLLQVMVQSGAHVKEEVRVGWVCGCGC